MNQTQKIVTNRCIGSFGLSREAFDRLREMGNPFALSEPDDSASGLFCEKIDRTDPMLIRLLEELGEPANGPGAKMQITEIPSGVHWGIIEEGGYENVAEKLRIW